MTLAATEVHALIFSMGTRQDLGASSITLKVPVDTERLVIGSNKPLAGAFGPNWLSVNEFDGNGGVLVHKGSMALLCTDKAV